MILAQTAQLVRGLGVMLYQTMRGHKRCKPAQNVSRILACAAIS